METFLIRVMTAVITSDEVKKMLSELMRNAVSAETEVVKDSIVAVGSQVDSLEKNALGNLDAMDGKMGNLNQQLTSMPGEMIKGIIEGVLGPMQELLKNPLGGLFGQR